MLECDAGMTSNLVDERVGVFIKLPVTLYSVQLAALQCKEV